MKNYSAENERIKRRYFAYLKEAMRHSEQTVDGVAKALARFEEYTKYKPFKAFHYQQAVAFKKHLAEQLNEATGKKLSKATLHATLANLKRFFHWLAGQSGYKSLLQFSDADYFNLSDKDTRIATAKREQKAPTLEQAKHALSQMPTEGDIARRNRALMAFTLLTGARDSAIASIKLKHVDIVEGSVYQDAREVRTKFSKSFTTYFFPVGDEVRAIVVDWVNYLRKENLWGNDDPLFPATAMRYGKSRKFEVAGLDRKHWSNATPIRKIFKDAFEAAGLPYFNPHSFRHMLAKLGQQMCRTPEDYKAWSQNLGHEKVMTTFYSYGEVDCSRQGQIIRGLGKEKAITPSDFDALTDLMERVRKSGML